MTTPRFLLDEHVWHGLVRVAQENGTAESFKDTYRFIQEFV